VKVGAISFMKDKPPGEVLRTPGYLFSGLSPGFGLPHPRGLPYIPHVTCVRPGMATGGTGIGVSHVRFAGISD
jgi:hypothetical protein